jgi:hypothetical protein
LKYPKLPNSNQQNSQKYLSLTDQQSQPVKSPLRSAPSAYLTTFINRSCCDPRCFELSVSQTNRHCQHARTVLTPITTRFILIFFGQVSRLIGPLSQAIRSNFWIPPSLGFQILPTSTSVRLRIPLSLVFQIPSISTSVNPRSPIHSDSRFRQFRLQHVSGFQIPSISSPRQMNHFQSFESIFFPVLGSVNRITSAPSRRLYFVGGF